MTTPPPESSDRTPSIDKPPKCGNKTRKGQKTYADHHHDDHTSSMCNTRTNSITEFEPEPFQMSGGTAFEADPRPAAHLSGVGGKAHTNWCGVWRIAGL